MNRTRDNRGRKPIRRNRPLAKTRRPSLETLEDRVVLATLATHFLLEGPASSSRIRCRLPQTVGCGDANGQHLASGLVRPGAGAVDGAVDGAGNVFFIKSSNETVEPSTVNIDSLVAATRLAGCPHPIH